MQAGADIGDVLNFDDIEIDTGTFELRRAGQFIPVEPRVFDLIRCLADSAGQVLTREDLITPGLGWAHRVGRQCIKRHKGSAQGPGGIPGTRKDTFAPCAGAGSNSLPFLNRRGQVSR